MAQDGSGAFGAMSTNVAIVVSSGGGGTPLTLVTSILPNGTRGVFYSQQLVASGGRQPYTWSSTGILPVGLTLNASTGVLSGTPTAAAGYSFTITVRDADGRTASKLFKVLVK